MPTVLRRTRWVTALTVAFTLTTTSLAWGYSRQVKRFGMDVYGYAQGSYDWVPRTKRDIYYEFTIDTRKAMYSNLYLAAEAEGINTTSHWERLTQNFRRSPYGYSGKGRHNFAGLPGTTYHSLVFGICRDIAGDDPCEAKSPRYPGRG